jgi:hypothetical protein
MTTTKPRKAGPGAVRLLWFLLPPLVVGFPVCCMVWPELHARFVEPLKSLATIGAAGVGVFVALRGLQTWRRQLHGTARFEACRKLLEKTLAARDAFTTFRSPHMDGGEMAAALRARKMPEPSNPGDRKLFEEGFRLARIDRFEKVFHALRDVESAVLVAEVVLGPKVREAFQSLKRCYVDAQIALEEVGEAGEEEAKSYRRILAATHGPQNEFTQRIEAAVEAVRQLTEPHIQARFAI